MKKIMTAIALITTFSSASSFAALNAYLQLKGSKGATQVITCPDGACSAATLAPDTYSVTVVDAQGKPVAMDSAHYACSIVSPRDAASGLPTGKRMHKPFVITKEMQTSEIVVAQDEPTVSISCTNSSTVSATTDTAVKASYDLKAAKK